MHAKVYRFVSLPGIFNLPHKDLSLLGRFSFNCVRVFHSLEACCCALEPLNILYTVSQFSLSSFWSAFVVPCKLLR